jgi:STE24 endopeptidase
MPVAKNPEINPVARSRRYSTIKYGLHIIGLVYVLLLLAGAMFSGLSGVLARAANLLAGNKLSALALYLFIIYAAYYILSFPLNFYQSFILEHQFQLTRQSVKDWFWDQVKAGVISYIISFALLAVFYALLSAEPQNWWWIISLVWVFLSLVLAKLAPVVIVPLFFKYKKFSDEDLRKRIIGLSRKMKLKILDVFEIDLSRKTEKANAALIGFGNTRRVILGDTLKNKYTPDEIEMILAHEFAHQKAQHLLKLLIASAFSTVFCSYLIYKTSFFALGLFGLDSLKDIRALPLVFFYLVLSGAVLAPWENFLSRKLETEADKMALLATGGNEAFISMMDKLATQNLADRDPHPAIKFFFFDHPSIDDRIKLARSLKVVV